MVDIDLKSSQQTNHIYLSKDDVSDDNPTEILVRATFTFIGTRRIKYKKMKSSYHFLHPIVRKLQKVISMLKKELRITHS